MMKNYDVIIVGAGPVGLATAIGLKSRGINNFIVLDQASEFRRVGQVIDLLPNGLKALHSIDQSAYEAIKQTGFNFLNQMGNAQSKSAPRWSYKNLKGEEIYSFPLSYDLWHAEYGEGRLPMAWYDLQTTLREQLPADKVQANHRCINVSQNRETGTVKLDFTSNKSKVANPYAHWETQSKNIEESPQNLSNSEELTSFQAQLVVAADGINSTLRQLIYNNTPYAVLGKPDYSGFAGIYCFEVGDIPEDLESEIQATFLKESRISSIVNDEHTSIESPRMILLKRQNFGYFLHLPISYEKMNGTRPEQWVDIVIQSLKSNQFPESLIQFVGYSILEKMQSRFFYIHRATLSDALKFPNTADLKDCMGHQPPWHLGSVVLAGDAAHGMPPFMAQGANQGLEDAFILSSLIAHLVNHHHPFNQSKIAEAFEIYESIRRPLMETIQKETLYQNYYDRKHQMKAYQQQVYGRDFNQMITLNF